MAVLDHLTQGRLAWNVVTGYLPDAARNHGLTHQVKHDDRPARLILNRRPPAEGWAWLKYEDDGQEFEADLGTVQLVALLEG